LWKRNFEVLPALPNPIGIRHATKLTKTFDIINKIKKIFYFSCRNLCKLSFYEPEKIKYDVFVACFFSILFLKKEADFSGDSSQSSQNFLRKKINVSYLNQPGVYEILDVKNDKSYYGETSYLLGRLEVHFRSLRKGNHFCKALQESYNKISDSENFQFFIIVYGSKWLDKEKRVKFQDNLIKTNKDRWYNQTFEEMKSPPVSKIRRISYKGIEYPNVRGAVKLLESTPDQISRSHLKRLLLDPNVTYAFYLDSEEDGIEHGSIPVFAKKPGTPLLLFPSIRKVLEAGFAKSHLEVVNNAEKNIEGWYFPLLDTDGKPRKGLYTFHRKFPMKCIKKIHLNFVNK
jgi:hypothetical protein